MQRCKWVGDDPLMISYHDHEYGFVEEDDNKIFERLMLEVYQAGLSWKLVLQKRQAFNDAFYNFNINKVRGMTDDELEEQRSNPDIIRNKLKIYATRNNAQICSKLISEHGSLLNYLHTLNYRQQGDAKTFFKPVIKRMKKDGFKFIGPLVLEEFFMSIGMNPVSHDKQCFMNV